MNHPSANKKVAKSSSTTNEDFDHGVLCKILALMWHWWSWEHDLLEKKTKHMLPLWESNVAMDNPLQMEVQIGKSSVNVG